MDSTAPTVLLLVVMGAALVVGLVVWIVQERRRAGVLAQLEAMRSGAAVAQAALESLRKQHEELKAQSEQVRQENLGLAIAKQELVTSLGELRQRFQEQADALAAGEVSRREAEDARVKLDAAVGVTQEKLTGLQTAEQVLRASFARIDDERVATRDALTKAEAALSAVRIERDALAAQLAEQKAWVEEQTKLFSERVLATAASLMDERGKAFTETNKKEVENVVGPFKAQLDAFRQRVDHIYSEDVRDRGALTQQIVQLTSLNQTVAEEAKQLRTALTVQSKSAGNWGETILAKILEDSGLRNGHEYALQVPIKGRDGQSLQPDAVIYLPEDRQLVVDSKVSLKAWTEYCAAGDGDEAARESALAAHLLSIRTHVKGLSGKGYSDSPDLKTADFVILFVPVEAALLKALQSEPSLYADAYRAKIMLVSPSTLMAVVKLTEGLWVLQKRKESADEVFELGRKLYEKLTNFAQTFVDVGNAIKDSQNAYDKAHGQLATGRGNAIGLAEKMKELGVTPGAGKGMPGELLELAGEPGGDGEEGQEHASRLALQLVNSEPLSPDATGSESGAGAAKETGS